MCACIHLVNKERCTYTQPDPKTPWAADSKDSLKFSKETKSFSICAIRSGSGRPPPDGLTNVHKHAVHFKLRVDTRGSQEGDQGEEMRDEETMVQLTLAHRQQFKT